MTNNNINTLSAITAEAQRIAAANKAEPKPEYVTAYHDLWENAKQCLSREDQAQLWECMKPKASGIDRFAGKKWRADHPDAPASPMPKYVTDAQAERKAKAAEKPAQPKAESKPAAKAKKPAQPKAESKPAAKPTKAKEPTQKDVLAALLVSMNKLDRTLASMDKRLAAVEKKLAK